MHSYYDSIYILSSGFVEVYKRYSQAFLLALSKMCMYANSSLA